MENKEEILSALENFNSKDDSITEIPEILETVIKNIATTGETVFPWPKLKQLVLMKVDLAMKTFQESASMDSLPPLPNVENVKFESLRKRILDRLVEFNGAPFTIQRIAELVVEPKKYYKRTDKFLRGIEKNVMVVTTVDPTGNIIVNDSKLMNGMDENGFSLDRDSGFLLTSAASSAAHSGERTRWSALSEWLQKPAPPPQPGATSSLFSTTETSNEPKTEADAKTETGDGTRVGVCTEEAAEDSSSQGSEDSNQGSEKSESSASSLSSDDGSSQKAVLEEPGVSTQPSTSERLDVVDTSTGFLASTDNIEGEESKAEESETIKEAVEKCEQISENTSPPESASVQTPQEQVQTSGQSVSTETGDTVSADLERDKEETASNEAEPMDTGEEEVEAKDQQQAPEEGQGDSLREKELDGDENEESSVGKKRKSDEVAAMHTPPSKRLVADDSSQAEAVTSPDRRESCGFETNPNCEDVESSSNPTQQENVTSTQASDVTSTSECATSQNVGPLSEAHCEPSEAEPATTDSDTASKEGNQNVENGAEISEDSGAEKVSEKPDESQ